MYLSEYLPRLEQISIAVDVPAGSNSIKGLLIVEKTVFLETATLESHEEGNAPSSVSPRWRDLAKHEILLPVSEEARLQGAKITRISLKNAVVSLTLTLAAQGLKPAPTPFTGLSSSNGIWSVDDLLRKTPRDSSDVNCFNFTCVSCGSVIVDSKSHKFVDMPLEYWHEMMDFWHCHKPHEPQQNIGINAKNYEGKLYPKPGFVHVGLSYLLVPSKSANCNGCGCILGTLDADTLRIDKWNLHLQYDGMAESYPPFSFVYFAILDRMNSSGARKFAVKVAGSSSAYKVWVTGVGLDVSYAGRIFHDCLKLLYVHQETLADDDVIEVPLKVWESMEAYFLQHTALLPTSHRHMELTDGDTKRRYSICYLSPQGGDLK